MKKIINIYILLFIGFASYSQNNITIYDFANAPQALLLNPAYDIEAQYHVTIPIFGSNKLSMESSGFSAYDIFANNSIPFQDKIENTVYQLTSKDFILGNQKMGIINIGQRINKDLYISYGLYEEADFYTTLPVELLKLPFEGTTYSGKKYSFEGLNLQANLLSVFHVGIQKKFSKQLNIGARLKLYNSAFDFSTTSMKGSFKTDINSNNTRTHSLTDIDIELRSAGLPIKIDDNNKVVRDNNNNILLNDDGEDIIISDYLSRGSIFSNTFFTGNKGIGIDLGVTYKIKKTTLSASINDLGVIYNGKLTQTYSYKGDYIKEGLAFDYDSSQPQDYIERLINDIDDSGPIEILDKGYFSLRPFQINLFATYGFGGIRNNQCQYLKSAYSYKPIDKIGAHIYAQKRPDKILYEASVFYERKITNGLLARVNYTVNRYSASNLGIAASGQIGKLNLYAGVNNILALTNLAKAQTISAQLGINILLPRKH